MKSILIKKKKKHQYIHYMFDLEVQIYSKIKYMFLYVLIRS